MILSIWSAFWNWITGKSRQAEGRIQEKADALLEDPHAIDAIYRQAIEGDKQAVDQLANAVGGLHARLASDEALLKRLISDPEDGLGRMRTDLEGAQAIGEQRYAELQKAGKTEDEITADNEFQEAMNFFEDTESTIEEREARLAEVKDRIAMTTSSLVERKAQLQSLHRALERKNIKREEAKADAVVAKQLEQVAGVLAGINVDGHNAELQRAEEALARMKGRAKAKSELAGMDATAQRAKFRQAAAKKHAAADFLGRVRGTVKTDASLEPEVKATDAAATESTGTGKGPSGPAPLS